MNTPETTSIQPTITPKDVVIRNLREALATESTLLSVVNDQFKLAMTDIDQRSAENARLRKTVKTLKIGLAAALLSAAALGGTVAYMSSNTNESNANTVEAPQKP